MDMSYSTAERKRIEGTEMKSITSAEDVCFVRAVGNHENDSVYKNPDYLAKYFVRPFYYFCSHFKFPFRAFVEHRLPGGYYLHIVRTKWIDELVKKEVTRGVEQLVILGAGFDTRSIRLKDQLSNCEIYELDYPATQKSKTKKLNKVVSYLPTNLHFVAIDFTQQSIDAVLSNTTFDPNKKTFFLWEGVSYYLDSASIDTLLASVKRISAAGSSIAFDYTLRSFVEGDLSHYGAKGCISWLKGIGEAFIFGIDEQEIDTFLTQRGFEIESDLGPDELNNRYLKLSTGKIKGRMNGVFRMVHARKTARK